VIIKRLGLRRTGACFGSFPQYNITEKVGREDLFRPAIGNEILHEINKINMFRLVKFPAS